MIIIKDERLYKNSKITFISSIFLGLYFSVPAINETLILYIGAIGSLTTMSFLYLFFAIVLAIACMIKIFRYPKINIFILLYIDILILYFLSTISGTALSTLPIVEFLLYVIGPILFIYFLDIDVQIFLKAAIVSPALAVLNLNKIFRLREYAENISMGTSYAFLFPIICSIVYLLIYFSKSGKKNKFLMIPFLLVNGITLLNIFMYGSRGPLLCVGLCILFLFLFEHNTTNGYGIKQKSSYRLIISIVVGLYILLNFWNILQFISDMLGKNNLTINFIRKLLELHQENDLLNGRNNEYSVALNGIYERFFLGHGLSTFTYYTGYSYPHNFILQLLYDGGIVLFFVFVIPFVTGVVKFFVNCKKEEFIFVIALLSFSVPSALFTGDLWKKPALWALSAILLLFSQNAIKRSNCETQH